MPIIRKPIDTSVDDKILIGMIVSEKYLEGVRSIYQSDLMENPFSRTIAQWCLEHFEKYKTCPGIHLQEIVQQKLRQGLDTDISELIEAFLSRISAEYEKAPHINHEYLLDETETIFNRRALKLLSEDIDYALDQEEDVGAIFDLVREHKDKKIEAGAEDFKNAMMTSTELIAAKIKIPKAIVWPWLREKSLNMIFSERGLGKSWLAMILAVAITRENYDEQTIGNWYVKHQCGVLYVDGEMGNFDLQDRIKQLAAPLGKESRRFPLMTFSTPDYTEAYDETVNLNTQYWQDRFFKFFQKNLSIRVLILDNLSSLCSGREENDNQSTSLLNAWFIKLRALGVSVIIIHHQGKTKGQQRGASALEDPLNNSIYLSKPKDWARGEGAHFKVQFVKARNDPGGEGYRSFDLKVVEHEENHRWRQWIDI